MPNCGICNEAITAIPDSITCYNTTCSVVYHSRCAGLSRTKILMLTEIPNLHYYCNCCCGVTLSNATAPATPVAPVDDISSHLVSIKESLTILTDAFKSTSNWPVIGSHSKTTKRRREDDDVENVIDPVRPVSFWPQKQQSSTVVGSAVDVDGLLVVEPRKDLVVSMLSPSTETDQLEDFIKKKLSIPNDSNEIRIRKLVAADKDISTLDYVSFKISVSGLHFGMLMSPNMWPMGVRVREFQYRPRKSRPVAAFLPPAELASTQPLSKDPSTPLI